jgi:RHS repeat-associated protein
VTIRYTVAAGHKVQLMKRRTSLYDLNGNITHLERSDISGNPIANYTYNYDASNKLQNINGGTSYTYDANGNTTTDGLRSMAISYNMLNLPQTISKNGESISYIYTATGEKVAKRMKDNSYQYYAGSFIYNSDKTLNYLLFSEGRVLKSSGGFSYEYQLKDHLGNTRVAFSSSHSVLQVSDYYAFGSSFAPHSPNNDNKYLYNGKELQDDILSGTNLDWLDYGARFYDPVIGRWHSVDPLAEKYYYVNPYSYCADNPIIYVDKEGKEKIISLDPNTPDNQRLIKAANKYKDDGAIHVWAHGSPGSITIYNGKKNEKITSTNDFQKFLTDNSKIWRNKGKDHVTIILHSCETGKEKESGKESSFARKLSEDLENTTVIAPTENVIVDNDTDTEGGTFSTTSITENGKKAFFHR